MFHVDRSPFCSVSALLMSVILPFVQGCEKKSDASQVRKAETAVPVILAAPKIESVQRYVEVVGTLWGDEDATISNKVPGKVIAIYKDIGDRVASGEPLAQL